jgi:hypothetical protein
MNFGNGVARAGTDPFKFWVVDNYLPEEMADQLAFNFPEPTEEWYKYANMFEMKRATDRLELMPNEHVQSLLFGNSYLFIRPLEELTGIDGLIPDPWFRGGGLHWIGKGGLLKPHLDFNWHKKLKLSRKLNALLYLNKGYKKEYGGALKLYDKNMNEKVVIEPLFNRYVIFETDADGFHGHPDAWAGPTPRRSMAWYFYQSDAEEPKDIHSTKFQKLPDEETTPEIEALRMKRNEGRL